MIKVYQTRKNEWVVEQDGLVVFYGTKSEARNFAKGLR